MSMWFVSPSRSLFSRHPWLIKIPQASTTAGSKLPIRSAAVNRVSARKSIGGRVHKYPTPSFPYPLLFPHPACAPQRRDFRCAATRVCGSCVRASAGSCVCAGAARAHAHTHADACARSRAPRRRIFTCVVGEKPVWRFGRGWGRRDGAFLKTYLACPCAWARARALKHADLQKQAKPCFFFLVSAPARWSRSKYICIGDCFIFFVPAPANTFVWCRYIRAPRQMYIRAPR
jgi:hypothetical protein